MVMVVKECIWVVCRAVARVGGGMYFYVQDEKLVGPCFADCLGGLLSVRAQNIRVRMVVPPAAHDVGIRLGAIHTHYARTPPAKDGDPWTVSLSDLQEGETRDLLCSL